MKKVFGQFHYGEKGFTLIELLVVVAILGVLAAVAVPNVGKFIGKGKSEALETELHNVQTATMAMMVDSSTGNLTSAFTATRDMNTITAPSTSGTLYLKDYLTGLDGSFQPKTGASYAFTQQGTVTQTPP